MDRRVANYGFDVTPARLVSALITERGIISAEAAALAAAFPERSAASAVCARSAAE
jgi:methylthioribose-1-phosphate isomerase